MYKLNFELGKTKSFNNILEWHKEIIKLQKKGINYYHFTKTDFGYEFFF